jgi:translation initiation factor 3 subunit C
LKSPSQNTTLSRPSHLHLSTTPGLDEKQIKMSRFFHGDSSSESSSDEEELYSDQEEEEKPASDEESSEEEDDEDDSDEDSSSEDEDGVKKTGANRFMRGESESEDSSDDDTPKVVKSAKDKRFEELEGTVKAMENGQKINDWGLISGGMICSDLMIFWLVLTSMLYVEFDKLNRQVAKLAAGTVTPKVYIKAIADLEDFLNETISKQKVSTKKMNATNARGMNAVKQKIKKNNKDYQKDVDAYRADKDAFMESDEEEEVVVPKPKKSKPVPGADASFEDDDEGFSTVGKGGKTLQFTPESILKHLRSIMESRGKKNTDRTEQIKIMEKLYEVATTPYQQIRVLLTLISTRFDISTGSQTFMSQEQWKSAEQEFAKLLEVLETNTDIVVVELAEEWEDDEKAPVPIEGQKLKIPGSIVSYVERLDDELTRSLQHIDPHTAEYIERLSDEGTLYNNIVRTLLYVENLRTDESLQVPQESANRIVMRRLEHAYFKVCLSCLLFRFSLANPLYSLPALLRFLRRTAGRQSLGSWTQPSLPAVKPPMRLLSSIFSATTFSFTAKESFVHALCFAKFISLRYTTTTTRLAI